MKKLLSFAIGGFLFLLLAAPGAWAFGWKDVKDMSLDGIPDRIIIERIEASGKVFRLDQDQVDELYDAGVSDEVVTAMLRTERYGYESGPYYRRYYDPYYDDYGYPYDPGARIYLGSGHYGSYYPYYGRSHYYPHHYYGGGYSHYGGTYGGRHYTGGGHRRYGGGHVGYGHGGGYGHMGGGAGRGGGGGHHR